MYISLNGCDWKLQGWLPYSFKFNRESGVDFQVPYFSEWMDAEVPGSIHNDLLKAGMIEEPYFETNALKCEWVENKCWVYKKSFNLPASCQGKKAKLIFEGVDYKASYFFNGTKLGESENMFARVEFDISALCLFGSENILEVYIEEAPDEYPQMGYTSKSVHQKSRFNYSWDFCTRLVNMGIWQDVGIKLHDSCTLGDVHIMTDVEHNQGKITVCGTIDGYCQADTGVEMILARDGRQMDIKYCKPEWQEGVVVFSGNFEIDEPELWYPNGMGSQELYDLDIRVHSDAAIQDEASFKTGIRKLSYEVNEGASADAMPFTVKINDEKVYIKGVNLVPLDHMYGAVNFERYRHMLMLAREANVNLIRVWGGGIIEKECFYRLCDEYGIMVWQEFIQSNSGIDGFPCTDATFLKKLSDTAINAVKCKRNHVSLVFWGGGNELKDSGGRPVSFDNMNIAMLKSIVEKYDPQRLFYPSCPCGPNFMISVEEKSLKEGLNHNIHGFWAYLGVQKHYELFNKSNSLFHAEFGVNGCSCVNSLQRFLSGENLKPCNVSNFVWRYHGGAWWDSYQRERDIFGEKSTESLQNFVMCSQFIQAEGIRYVLEANRRRKYRNSGSIIWQLNEPWPNANCSNIVDYYGEPKMAYYWTKKAYEPVHISLRYPKLNFCKGESFKGEIYVNSTLVPFEGAFSAEVLDAGGRIILKTENTAAVSKNSSQKLFDLSFPIEEEFPEIFFIRLRLLSEGSGVSENIYIFSTRSERIFEPLFDIRKGKLSAKYSYSANGASAELTNTGTEVCLFVHVYDESEGSRLYFDNNHFIIFPGETVAANAEIAAADGLRRTECRLALSYLNG